MLTQKYCTSVHTELYTPVWFVNHISRQSSENVLNLLIGQYFLNILYCRRFLCKIFKCKIIDYYCHEGTMFASKNPKSAYYLDILICGDFENLRYSPFNWASLYQGREPLASMKGRRGKDKLDFQKSPIIYDV